jgi:signal transduction histidine kinase/CheY-like chemotaxis protein
MQTDETDSLVDAAHEIERADHSLALALAEVARSVSATLDLHTTLERVFDRLADFVPFDSSAIMLLRDEQLTVVAGRGFPISHDVENVVLPVRPGVTHYPVIAEARTLVLADTHADPGWQRVPAHDLVRSWIGVPLQVEERTIGMLTIDKWEAGVYTMRHAAVAQAFAGHVALAVRNAQLYTDSQRAYAELSRAQAELLHRERLSTLGQMTSGIAHDFNNILTGILGNAQLLQLEATTPALRNGLELIVSAAQHAAVTTRRLQEYTRAGSNGPLLPVNLAEVAEVALALTRPRWQAISTLTDVKITLTTQLQDAYTTPAEAAELLQVAINLILNAVDAMAEGGEMRIVTGMTATEAFLAVQDTGGGIAPDFQSRIFEPFVTTKGARGSGMGLAMSQSLAARHGGRITVTSELGSGSLFTIWLPRGILAHEPPQTSSVAAPRDASGVILLVEDDRYVRDYVERALCAAGYSVRVVTQVADAMIASVIDNYDIVITNLSMPQRSGWELVRWIRNGSAETGIIVMSGWALQEIEATAQSQQVDHIIAKPFSVDDLHTAVGATLAAVRARRGKRR